MAIIEVADTESFHRDMVGPVIRSGPIADAVIDAVAEDNPDRDVLVLDRDDYVRVHTDQRCRLTRASLEKYLGHAYQLAALEIDMPSFTGRLRTRTDEYLWFYETTIDATGA